MTPVIYILRGLQASGKSTWRKSNPDLPYVNKDELRIDNPGLHEGKIHELQFTIMQGFASHGNDFIVDNTHLNPKNVSEIERWARERAYSTQIVDFNTSYMECIKRDERRRLLGQAYVGKDVIIQTALRWNRHPHLGKVILFDIDGTLADLKHRLPYLKQEKKDWKSFNAGMAQDGVHEAVAEVFRALEHTGWFKVICLSGRVEKEAGINNREVTRKWLDDNYLFPYLLLMRRERDYRPDEIVKRELYENYLKNQSQTLGVFDDRPRVIRMWKDIGLKVFDVGEGVEF